MPQVKGMDGNNEVIGTYSKTQQRSTGSNISIDDFLKIMAAEISNQSMDAGSGGGGSKTDYISQLSQLTQLQYMEDLNGNMAYLMFQQEQNYANSLIGTEVKVINNQKEQVIGVVDKIKYRNGFTLIEIDGEEYYVSQVIESGKGLTIDEDLDVEEAAKNVNRNMNRPNSKETQVDFVNLPERGKENKEVDVILPKDTTTNNRYSMDGSIPDTKPMKRSEITEEYLKNQFLEEKEFFDKNFHKLNA